MKAYKGFNKDMTCRDFQYEEGKEYKTERASVCNEGFHSCKYPLDVFSYYNPADSEYHEVEVSGEIDEAEDDSKIASTYIKIGAKLDIVGLVKAAINFTMSRVKPEAKATEDYGASSATGYKGASSATGDCGASSATGDKGASSATGDCGASSATGDCGASSATGYKGASSATGDCGASSATGNCGASLTTGYCSSAESGNPQALAIAFGYKSKAKGVKGSYIVLADWEDVTGDGSYWKPEDWKLKGVRVVHIDGKKYKADTFYTMRDGKVVEVDE